jgi:hypothetical protein
MNRMIFLNLPVRDLPASLAFYTAVGAVPDERFCDATAAMVKFSDEIRVMLISHERFADFTTRPIVDAHQSVQALFCLSAESRAAVDAMVADAVAAGAEGDPSPVEDYGWMYGRSFADPDGHLWGINWMDVEAATRAMAPQAA